MPYIIEQGQDDEFIYVVPDSDPLSDNYVTIGTEIPIARRLQLAKDIATLLDGDFRIAYRLYLEMGYADYSPGDQSTPSMIESVGYATEELCREAHELTYSWIRGRYPDHGSYWSLYQDMEPVLCDRDEVCEEPVVPKQQIAVMMMHYLGEDALDDDEDYSDDL